MSAGKKERPEQTWEGSDFKITVLHNQTPLHRCCYLLVFILSTKSPAVGAHTPLTLLLKKRSGIVRDVLWCAVKALLM